MARQLQERWKEQQRVVAAHCRANPSNTGSASASPLQCRIESSYSAHVTASTWCGPFWVLIRGIVSATRSSGGACGSLFFKRHLGISPTVGCKFSWQLLAGQPERQQPRHRGGRSTSGCCGRVPSSSWPCQQQVRCGGRARWLDVASYSLQRLFFVGYCWPECHGSSGQ